MNSICKLCNIKIPCQKTELEKFFLGMQREMLDLNDQFPLALQIFIRSSKVIEKIN